MKIKRATIKNFRLLSDVTILFESETTVIVGRNNSGKTSLTEVFRKFFSGPHPFVLEDFSLTCHGNFWDCYKRLESGSSPDEVVADMPQIHLILDIEYNLKDSDLGLLSEFIIDLDPTATTARLELKYAVVRERLRDLVLSGPLEMDEDTKRSAAFKALREFVKRSYYLSVEAVDPNDKTNRKALDLGLAAKLVKTDFVNAQRTLDDSKSQDSNVLGKVLESIFKSATGSDQDDDKKAVAALKAAVSMAEEGMRTGFSAQLDRMLPAFEVFGYPGFSDPRLKTETNLDVESLLQSHTKVKYPGLNGINLPESHNGLGSRNLIYILLVLMQYFKSYHSAQESPGVHLIFVEEPEAHLHPQMQEVFIDQLKKLAEEFSKSLGDDKPWPVQFVVTTHSPHVANKAAFSAMRYFLAESANGLQGVCTTTVKDLNVGFQSIPTDNQKFLHQYLTLTRCDLLFADKAILIEGSSERLLLPVMMSKFDATVTEPAYRLGSQYLSVIEVGGAYAHLFFQLQEFLQLKTLVITDIDSVGEDMKACPVTQGKRTSNACIKNWTGDPKVTIQELLGKTEAEKSRKSLRIAYQIPEVAGDPCGRSLEAAFMLANRTKFTSQDGSALTEADAWDAANGLKKSDFALRHAVDDTDWNTPKYILEGLAWLAGPDPGDAVVEAGNV